MFALRQKTLQRSLRARFLGLVSRSGRRFSSDQARPLFLWLGDDSQTKEGTVALPRLLLPASTPPPTKVITDASMALELVNQHYESESQFVGGMGESDLGVWFATTGDAAKDTLDYAPLIQETIAAVKQERHGVPFGAYTTGIVSSSLPISEIGLSVLQVSMMAGTPNAYKRATGLDSNYFVQVCGFIAQVAEQGMAVQVGLLKSEAGAARELALSLGAQQVEIYDVEGEET